MQICKLQVDGPNNPRTWQEVQTSVGLLYLWTLVINMHNSHVINNPYLDFCHLPYLEVFGICRFRWYPYVYVYMRIYVFSLCIFNSFFYEMIIHICYITCFKGLDMHVYMHIFMYSLGFSRFLVSSFLFLVFLQSFPHIKALSRRTLARPSLMSKLFITWKKISHIQACKCQSTHMHKLFLGEIWFCLL